MTNSKNTLRVSEDNLLQLLSEQQDKAPLDYEQVLGALVSPFVGSVHGNLMAAKEDVTAALVEILSGEGRLKAASSETFTATLAAFCTFLSRLQVLSESDDHLFTLANLYDVRRWDDLSKESRESLLISYGHTDELA